MRDIRYKKYGYGEAPRSGLPALKARKGSLGGGGSVAGVVWMQGNRGGSHYLMQKNRLIIFREAL